MTDVEIKYETKVVTTVRGMEARSIQKWQKEGWEFVSQNELPLLRTQLNFRRLKPKPPWLLIGAGGGVLVVLGIIITVMSLVTGGDDATAQPPATPTSTAAATPESEESESEESVPTMKAYSYQGPQYELVTVDESVSDNNLKQYWVFTDKFEYSTDAFKDQVKLIIADVVRNAKTETLIVQVVTDEEIIEAESWATIGGFMDEHGADYFRDVIAPKEKTDWVAWYTGGFDYDTGEPSEADTAFVIDWLPEGVEAHENWKPAVAG